jgi:hypothetical protein
VVRHNKEGVVVTEIEARRIGTNVQTAASTSTIHGHHFEITAKATTKGMLIMISRNGRTLHTKGAGTRHFTCFAT